MQQGKRLDSGGVNFSGAYAQKMDKELLERLCCPACKSDIFLKDDKVVCRTCRRRYPIREGIPVMLTEEAEIEENPERRVSEG